MEPKVGKVDVATLSHGEESHLDAKKILTLPGEYELSGVLIRGFYTHEEGSTVFKITLDDIVVAHFGNLPTAQKSDFFDELGENIDVVLITLHEGVDIKKAKEFLENIDPRMVIFGGDPVVFPKLVESFNAKVNPEKSLVVSRMSLPSETTDFVILTS